MPVCARCGEAKHGTRIVEEHIYGFYREKPLCPGCRLFRKKLAVNLVREHDQLSPKTR